MSTNLPDSFRDVLLEPTVEAVRLPDDGTYPNNEELRVLVYRQVFVEGQEDPAGTMEDVFRSHDWRGTWRNGIFSYHHYHSTAHEVLGVSRGSAQVQLGGPDGETFDLSAGDVVILPAGVAHKNLGADRRFQVVGAYPEGRQWDLKTGSPGERPEADRNIEKVPRPSLDPVYGEGGPLREHWSAEE